MGKIIQVVHIEKDITKRKIGVKKLEEAKQMFENITNGITDGVLLLSKDFKIIWANKAVLEQTGYKKEQILGDYCYKVTHYRESICQAPDDICPVEEIIKKGAPVAVEHIHYDKNGNAFYVEVSAYPVKDEKGEIIQFVHISRNVTEQKKVQESLRVSKESFNNIVNRTTDGLLIVNSNGIVCFVNPAAESILGRKAYELKNTLFGFPLDVDKPIEIDIVYPSGEPGVAEMRVTETKWEGEKAYLASLTDVTKRKKTQEELKNTLTKLRKSMNTIIQVIGLIVEKRDPYTAGHQQRVSNLSRAIAKEMGFSEEKIDEIRMAGIIHDLGKISIPSEILSKPGKITEVEFNMIKSHPQIGYNILRSVEPISLIAEIVLQHHERTNGSGYPNGLKGKDILVEAKILAVADVVEAMASHRPYREALGINKALDEISNNKGILYDPVVVNTCISLFIEKGFKL